MLCVGQTRYEEARPALNRSKEKYKTETSQILRIASDLSPPVAKLLSSSN